VDAATMLLGRHERGIHAVRPGTGGAEVTEDRSQALRHPATIAQLTGAAAQPERLIKHETKADAR
jgi:hypothetical protein